MKKHTLKKLGLGLTTMAMLGFVTGCEEGSTSADGNVAASEVVEDTAQETNDDILTLGSTFEFDNLEITLGGDINWTTIDNEFADHAGADVFYIPITVTNLSDETHGLNMFAVRQFGSQGTQLDSISTWFMENDIDFAGEMRSGATQEAYMHILYDGDGEYVLEFGFLNTEIEVKIPVIK